MTPVTLYVLCAAMAVLLLGVPALLVLWFHHLGQAATAGPTTPAHETPAAHEHAVFPVADRTPVDR